MPGSRIYSNNMVRDLLRPSADHNAGNGCVEDFASEDEFAGAVGTAAEEGGGFAKNDDIFDFGWVHGFGEDEGAEFFRCHTLELEASALSFGEVKTGDLGH